MTSKTLGHWEKQGYLESPENHDIRQKENVAFENFSHSPKIRNIFRIIMIIIITIIINIKIVITIRTITFIIIIKNHIKPFKKWTLKKSATPP